MLHYLHVQLWETPGLKKSHMIHEYVVSHFSTIRIPDSLHGWLRSLRDSMKWHYSLGLRGSRKLKPGALSLYVGDGHRAAVEAIGTYHYKSSLVDYYCLEQFKKRIEKLQHDGLLNSIDIESLGKCVSCLSGKMARKPYSHQVERAKDLLGLIHTDVCGPFRIVSRQGASYFVTFTDDFSRYGYVYLLKHKHEVFETFKYFATASTDAEYIAAFDASKEAVWIRKFISGLGIVPTIEEPISMYCDNTGAIEIAKDG
ncbi:retrotransposon protein, putative, ty1-copia subclass [Tanacetum coccineum]|uniref:Retrotransposon protein, putative, ty1-copia subclass n=1 Tax=Tanacetum coccineum TaxID=301880 RepID=A0ABQ5ADQ3_9ASTR